MLPENWNTLSSDEKFKARLESWVSTENKQFATPEAAAAYRRRAQRFADVIQLKEPDRVPRQFTVGGFVAEYSGLTHGDFFYDYEKSIAAMIKFHEDFDLDYQAAGNFWPGKAFDLLQYKLYRYPGDGLPMDRTFQCVEGEYMMADEYDEFIADPESYMMRTYTPRVLNGLGGLQILPTFFGTTELPFVPFMLAAIAAPPMQAALQTLIEASQAALEWLGASARIGAKTQGEMGLPGNAGGFSKAPVDFIGDTLRGTRGVMLDMFRRPEKLLAACEAVIPAAVKMAVDGANASGNPLILIPLHKGADGFMSNADFKKFYWPSFKATLLGIIEEGVIPFMFVEGGYNQRLDIIAESGLPAGKTMWMFDQSDMQAVKEKFGPWSAIGGNVSASLFKAGTPQQMEDEVKRLIDICAPGGGFFLAPGAVIDNAAPENAHAFLRAGREYGVYQSAELLAH